MQLRIHTARTSEINESKVDKSVKPGAIFAIGDDYLAVRCGTGVLEVTHVQQPGRKPVSARDFSHSHALAGRRLG